MAFPGVVLYFELEGYQSKVQADGAGRGLECDQAGADHDHFYDIIQQDRQYEESKSGC